MHYVQPAIKLVAELRLRSHGKQSAHHATTTARLRLTGCHPSSYTFGTLMRVIYFPDCPFHVNQEAKAEKPDTTQRQEGHGRKGQELVLEGTYTTSTREIAIDGHNSSKEESSVVPVQISALSKMSNNIQLEVTDAQLEQPRRQGDIDHGIKFLVPEIPFGVSHPVLGCATTCSMSRGRMIIMIIPTTH